MWYLHGIRNIRSIWAFVVEIWVLKNCTLQMFQKTAFILEKSSICPTFQSQHPIGCTIWRWIEWRTVHLARPLRWAARSIFPKKCTPKNSRFPTRNSTQPSSKESPPIFHLTMKQEYHWQTACLTRPLDQRSQTSYRSTFPKNVQKSQKSQVFLKHYCLTWPQRISPNTA